MDYEIMTVLGRNPTTMNPDAGFYTMPAGEPVMLFTENYTDYNAPEILATGVGKVERISTGLVRVTYLCTRNGEVVAAVHMIWDYWVWLEAWARLEVARDVIMNDLQYTPPTVGLN